MKTILTITTHVAAFAAGAAFTVLVIWAALEPIK